MIKWIITGFLVWIGIIIIMSFLGLTRVFGTFPILLGTIAILIIFLVKRPRKNSQDYDSFDYTTAQSTKKEIDRSRPLNIVKERLAKGEITNEEYNELKKEFE